MARISNIDDLRRLYVQPKGRSLTKQLEFLDPHCRRFIELSPFIVIASTNADGQSDASPRGEAPGFVHVLDDHIIAIPDRPGNNRLDTMQNILENPEIGVIFLVPGVNETLRVNGAAEIRDDAKLCAGFKVNGKQPATALVVSVREAYLHCAKALMRSRLWDAAAQHDARPIPTMGEMLRDQTGGAEPAESDADMRARYQKVLY